MSEALASLGLALLRASSYGGQPPRVTRVEAGWAHQDSNLERAGYEPAALTIELWARWNGKW